MSVIVNEIKRKSYTITLSERNAALVLAVLGAQVTGTEVAYTELAKALGDEVRQACCAYRPAEFSLGRTDRLGQYLQTLSTEVE